MTKNQLQLLLVGGVLLGATLFAGLLIALKPSVQKQSVKPKPRLVETITATLSSENFVIHAFGTVQPEEEITLTPEVSGVVTERAKNFIQGATVEKGELLLKINPIDYEVALEEAKAAVATAELELQLEEGRQLLAKKEWELLSSTIQETIFGEELALRVPHIAEKRAALKAAEGRLLLAEENLARTILKAPFDSVVLSESGDIGQYLTPQSEVARLAGIHKFRIIVSIPYSELKWVEVPGAKAFITQVIGGEEVLEKEGTVIQRLGDLDPLGRLVRLVVEVDSPLEGKPLLLGSYMRVEVQGPEIENLIKIPRLALQEENTLLLMDEDSLLEIRPVEILFRDEENLFISGGIEPGDEVVTTPIPLAVPGTVLRSSKESE